MTEAVMYERGACRNYMVIPCPGKLRSSEYQYRMLEENRIDGILPFSRRFIDDAVFLYYDVTSKQKLTSVYRERPIGGEALRAFLRQLAAAGSALAGYLLDTRRILLDPEMIYYDLTEEKYSFTYYPELTEKSRPAVFGYLAARADPADPEAAGILQRLRDMAEEENFLFTEELCDHLLRPEEKDEPVGDSVGDFPGDRADWKEDAVYMEDPYLKDPWQDPAAGFSSYGEEDGAVPEAAAQVTASAEKGGRVRLAGMVRWLPPAAAAAGAVLLTVSLTVLRDEVSSRTCLAAGAVLLIAGMVLLLRKVLRGIRDRGLKSFAIPWKRKNKEGQRDPWAGQEDMWNSGGDTDLPVWPEGGGEWTGPGPHGEPYAAAPVTHKNGAELEGAEMTCAELPEDVPIRLYGSGKARGQTIDLENLPCTVGKLSEYADAVLDAPSVSRMHVRFSRNARGELVMKDLNSTNGTFRNGLALKPEEEVRIERGDVIRIGALEFFCR